MSVEMELKLCITPEHLARLKRHPLLKTLATTRASTRRIYNIYYDTLDLKLHGRAIALRLRRIGKQWLQTLKGGGGVQAGLHQRNEWEMPVADEALDFAALKASGAEHLAHSVRKKLQPLFVTEFSRTTRILSFKGAEIELCMDSGEIRAGKARRPISELELELKSGEPAQLFKLAQALLDIVPLEIEHTSKAEYGYRLFADTRPAVVKAAMPDLAECPDVACALQTMIVSCLAHLQANVPGAVQNLDEEYLHQVRVALRRLRVVLAMAETFRADAELSALHEQVAELYVELGRLREWDVFVTQILAPIRARLPRQTGLRGVLRASEKLRAQHHAAVERKLQSGDYQRFLLRFGAWMHGGYWHEQAAERSTLAHFAAQILDKHSLQAGKRGKHLDIANPAQLHTLRIACKKLRYGAEIFASLFDAGKTKRYLSALSSLQDTLGALNDFTVAQRLLGELGAEVQQESVALIRGWIERGRMDKSIKLGEQWKTVSRQRAFWREAAGKKA